MPITDLASLLLYTSAIVEGTVVSGQSDPDKDYTYTKLLLEDVIVHRGAVRPGAQPTSMTLLQFGGTSPEGRTVSVTDVPKLSCGDRQLFFLINRNWRHTPLVPLWSIGVSNVRVVEDDGRTFLMEGAYALGSISNDGFGRADTEPLFEPSGETTPNTCDGRQPLPVLTRTDAPIPEGVIGVEEVLAAVDATGVQPSGVFQSEPYNWDKPIQGKRNCGDVEPYYAGCESHPDDAYTIGETGACLTRCTDGACEAGKSCVQTSVRPACVLEGSDVCAEQINVCIYAAKMDFGAPIDGHGAVVWGTIHSDEQLQDNTFTVIDGAASVAFAHYPHANGYDTPYGDVSAGRLRVIDTSVYDLHTLEDGTIPPDDKAEIGAAISANPESYASSCGYSIIFRDGEREPISGDPDAEAFAYVQDFPLGYSCARNLAPIDGKPVFEHIDCKQVKFTQGLCNEN